MTKGKNIIVANPSDPLTQELLKEILGPVEQKLAEIEKGTLESKCRFCGKVGQLTEEHTPSKKAFNFMDAISFGMNEEETLKLRQPVWEAEQLQGGSRVKSLCSGCNNKTGAWYNSEYLRFVRSCRDIAQEKAAGTTVSFSKTFRPSRVIKQGLATLTATCQSGLLEVHPEIGDLLRNRDQKGALKNAKVYVYLRANKGFIRSTGIATVCDLKKKRARLLAEFSAWPVGWLLVLDEEPFEGAADVTSWLELDYNERRTIELKLPCHLAGTPYPADFRDPQSVYGKSANK